MADHPRRDNRGDHHRRDQVRDREHGHSYGNEGRGRGYSQRNDRGTRGGYQGHNNHNNHHTQARTEYDKLQDQLRNEHGNVDTPEISNATAAAELPMEPDHLKYKMGSLPMIERQLIRSRDNKYAVLAETPEPGTNGTSADAGKDPVHEDSLKDIYVVVNVHALKWTHQVVFGKNTFIRRDIAIDKSLETNRQGALPGDVVVVKLYARDRWERQKKDDNSEGADASSPYEQHDEKHNPKGYKSGTATLPDGRKVHRALQHEPGKRYLGKAERIHNALNLGEDIAQEAGWEEELQPKGIIVAILERGFNRFQPCRMVLRTDPKNPDAPPQVPQIYANRYYTFKPFSEAYPYIAVYGDDIPSAFYPEVHEMVFLIEIKAADSLRNVPKPGCMVVHTEADEFIQEMSPERRVEVRHVDWKYPVGRVVMSLGRSGTVEAESRAIAASNQVTDREFSPEVEACVMKDFIIPSPEELAKMGRRDLRESEFICTIDPATARDLDDALSITHSTRPGNAGGYRVGVHIADVSYFVPINSQMDYEAKSRSTSVYFVERVIPMLPRKLSEDYCSLNAGTDKFAFSSIFELDPQGNVIDEWFGQSVIRNRCRMAYEDAQAVIDGDTSGDSLVIHPSELDLTGERTGKVITREDVVKKCVKSVQLLYKVASILRKRRYEKGALSLNKAKIRFTFEKDDKKRIAPQGFVLESSKEANWTIEEFMLLCNIRTAEKIVQYLPDCGMVRKHDPPIAKKSHLFITSVREKGYEINGGSSLALQQSLQKYKDDPNIDVLRLMATYTMSLAKYVSSGADEDASVKHYALATDLYTHFTSPIRRYCDVVAHRQLILALEIEQHYLAKRAALEAKLNGKNITEDDEERILNSITLDQLEKRDFYIHPAEVEAIADHANTKKQNARKCSDMSLGMFFCQYLKALTKQQDFIAAGNAAKEEQEAKANGTHETIIPAPEGPANANAIARFQVRCFVTKYTKEERFTLYAPDIAQDNELFHNSPTQRWVLDNIFKKETQSFICNWGRKGAKEGKRAIVEAPTENNEESPSDAKSSKKSPQEDTGKQKQIKAILRSQRDTDEKEELSLFSAVTATLRVVVRGTMQLEFVIDPPWERPAEVPQIPMVMD